MPTVHRRHHTPKTTTPSKPKAKTSTPKAATTTPKPAAKTDSKVVFQDGFDMSRATDTGQKTTKTLQQLAALASSKTDVPGRVQEGPTCGLYALGMVMDFWDNKDPKNLNPLVQDGDLTRADAKSRPADTAKELLPTAKGDGYTTKGEMFTADQLGKLASEFGYQYKTTTNVTLADMKAALKRGHPLLVGFDVDYVGNPGKFGGERAHWCVVEGMFKKDGVDYVVATHAWDGKDRIWKANDLLESMSQLHHSDFWGGETDISNMLDDRMVEVYPAGH
jgi:hypothetical protein